MIEIQLPGTEIRTTSIGFGCGRLFRVHSSTGRQRLLGAAFEAGIRHFDVARVYGLGAAEAELGKFAGPIRDQVVITTKFGIEPARATSGLARLQRVGRMLIGGIPSIRKLIGRRADRLYQRKSYTPETAARSLETSLRELQTEYVDLLLLHDPSPTDIAQSDIIPWLEKSKAEGKLREYGISGEFEDVAEIAQQHPELTKVLQFPSDALNRNAESLGKTPGKAMLTFSPLSPAIERIVAAARRSQIVRKQWTKLFGANVRDTRQLAALLMAYARSVNPNGVVLFSTTRPERLQYLIGNGHTPSTSEFNELRLLADAVASANSP
jgi:D-threo-aldose 1-dehydrogenase